MTIKEPNADPINAEEELARIGYPPNEVTQLREQNQRMRLAIAAFLATFRTSEKAHEIRAAMKELEESTR